MTETEWQNAQKPYTCLDLARSFRASRKLRLLMVGFLEPLEEIYSAALRTVLLTLREWAEDGRQCAEAALSPLANCFNYTPSGLATHAMSWVVNHGLRIEELVNAAHTYGIDAWSPDVAYKAAQALTCKKVGDSPRGVRLMGPVHQAWGQAWRNEFQAIQRKQADMMRCVYGPRPWLEVPKTFRAVTFDPYSCSSSTVVAFAQTIYTDRLFDRLPILADALEDAGCTNPDILAHCRGGGEHVRGCWVVDLLLGKE